MLRFLHEVGHHAVFIAVFPVVWLSRHPVFPSDFGFIRSVFEDPVMLVRINGGKFTMSLSAKSLHCLWIVPPDAQPILAIMFFGFLIHHAINGGISRLKEGKSLALAYFMCMLICGPLANKQFLKMKSLSIYFQSFLRSGK